MSLEKQNCPECMSSLVDDLLNGETICSGCGIVVNEQLADYGPEVLSSSLEDKMKLARATGHTTYSQHDLGISTSISISAKDFSGKSINYKIAHQMHTLRKWQQRVRVASAKERRLSNVLTTITNICENNNLSKNVLETASMIYRGMDGQVAIKGKSIVCMSAATIYMACKQCDVVRSLEEICKTACSPKEVKTKTKLAARYYRMMVMEMGAATAPVVSIDKYISRIANMTRTEVRVTRLALEVAEKANSINVTDGKDPNGIAAAYLYMSSVLLGQNILQKDVSAIAGVTEVTIRNRCREILSNHQFKIVLRPSLDR